MSFLSFFEGEKEEAALLIDIGNGTISASLVNYNTDLPTFLYCVKLSFPILDTVEGSHLVASMKEVLESTLTELVKGAIQSHVFKKWRPTHSLVTLSSPWFILKAKKLHLEQDNPFIITQSFLDDIAYKEAAAFSEEFARINPEAEKEVFEIIEKNIVHTKINGYVLDNSLGKRTRVFDAFLCMSVVDKALLNEVHNLILKHAHIPPERVTTHTFPLASFTVFRDMFPQTSDFLMMDITGEVTDITLVTNDIITQTVSFPSGRNFLIRQITKKFNCTNEIAESTLHLYMDKRLDDETQRKMDEVLVDTEKEWSIYMENALFELSPDINLPQMLFLTLDEDVAEIYKNFLTIQKLDATSTYRSSLKIVHIDAEKLKSYCHVPTSFDIDEFMLILAMFYTKRMSV